MKFRFEIDVKKLPVPITHHHKLLLMGSCFTENIGEKLNRYKFNMLQNPHGILFNPVSVAEALTDYINAKQFVESDLFYHNEAWHSWKHHSRFSSITATEAVQKINDSIQSAHQFLKRADYVCITLGSAWVYRLTSNAATAIIGAVAANNHKAPADWFQKELLKSAEVSSVLTDVLQRLKAFNPDIKIILTVSPVRHLREGAIENNRSKAALIEAVHEMTEKYDWVYYFPAYELVIDDLRDYRFYAEDLVHPNYFATQYVWEKLVTACMNETTKNLIDDIHSINLAYQHKAFNPSSEQHKKFMQASYKKTKSLEEIHPYLDFKAELNYFNH